MVVVNNSKNSPIFAKENNQLTKPVLIVMPKSVLVNWKLEIKKFTPNLKPILYYPTLTPKYLAIPSGLRDPSLLITVKPNISNNF